jgi:hypothetical protein
MIKVTKEMREAARLLLDRHNKAVKARAEARMPANKAHIKPQSHYETYDDQDTRKRLEAITDGTRKLIDPGWWQKVYRKVDRAKLEKIKAMADPARNSNEHERQVAETKLAAAKARRAPGMRPDPPPLPTDWSAWKRMRTTKAKDKAKTPTRPPPQTSPALSDGVAVSAQNIPAKPVSDSVAQPKANEKRTAERAAARSGLKCQTCGKPLAASRVSARYCSVTCRSRAWRA